MCIHNKAVSLVYKLVLLVVSGVALLVSLGLLGGGFRVDSLKYFSVALNAFCFLFYLASIIALLANINRHGTKGSYTYASPLKGDVMVSMVYASLLYAFLLAGSTLANTVYSPGALGLLVHLVVPVMLVADWLLFDRKGRYRAADPFYWLALPFLYLTFYSIYSFLLSPTAGSNITNTGAPFPYPFLDMYALGWGQSALRIGLFLLVFLALGYAVFALDKLLGHFTKKTLVSVPDAAAQNAGAQPPAAAGSVSRQALEPPAARRPMEDLQPPPPPGNTPSIQP